MKNPERRSTQTFVRTRRTWQVFILLAYLACSGTLTQAQAPTPDSPAIDAKAKAMLSKLTLEEKIKLIGGVDSMFTNAIPSIDLPRFKMSDASVGVRTWGP